MTQGEATAAVEEALPGLLTLCPRDFERTVTATVLNLAAFVTGGGAMSYRRTVRRTVAQQLSRIWSVGFLRSLTYSGNEFQAEVRRSLPAWDGAEPTDGPRTAVTAVRAAVADGTPVAAHLDAGLAFLGAADVVSRVAARVGTSRDDMARRPGLWHRYVDAPVPLGRVRTSMLRTFRYGIGPAMRARRAASPDLARAIPEPRLQTEVEALRANAYPLVAAVSDAFPGARFDALEASVARDGTLTVVPSFGDGETDLRLPLSHRTVEGATETMGGLLRRGGRGWDYAAPGLVASALADGASESTRTILDLWHRLTTDRDLDGFDFCVMGTREMLVGPRMGREAPVPGRVAKAIGELTERGVTVTLGLGASVTLGEVDAHGDWVVDRSLHVARLTPTI